MIFSATFAYFAMQSGDSDRADVEISTSTPDNLSFIISNDITISANTENFGIDDGNASGSATVTALLTANSDTNIATATYNLFFNVLSNEFVYTTDTNTPEIILSVTDPTGQPVTSIDGLTYYSDSEVPGFDITTYNGTITIASNYAINAIPETMQEWLVTVTFVNLDSDQQLNTDKSYLGELIVQTDEEFIPGTGSTVSPVLTAVESIQALYTADGENDLYCHDGIGDYGELEAGDNSYRYSGANPRNYVCFGTDTTPCPAENLYRIIGAFDDDNDGVYNLKLIKSVAYVQTIWGSYSVSSSYSWSTTSLNNTLNDTFYNSLGEYANNLVYIGTSGSSNYAYVYVVGSDGLVSSTKGSQSFVTSSTRIHYYQNINQNYSARPVFYLRSDISFSGGEGTMENPYTLEMR